MDGLTLGLSGVGLAAAGGLFVVFKLRRFIAALLVSAASGLLTLVLLNSVAGFIGIALPYSLFTLAGAVFGGVPGVVCMLLLRLICVG